MCRAGGFPHVSEALSQSTTVEPGGCRLTSGFIKAFRGCRCSSPIIAVPLRYNASKAAPKSLYNGALRSTTTQRQYWGSTVVLR
ncbi:MAG: hypothetical protein MJK14_27430, partial [Rivularia sp. ALOHA_DT_140]|nr:hypothetical protein [Rivularia sp. ALOHA_DT_140]